LKEKLLDVSESVEKRKEIVFYFMRAIPLTCLLAKHFIVVKMKWHSVISKEVDE
jgi:hypothetical protein